MTSHSLHGGPLAARWLLLPALVLFLLAGATAAQKGKAKMMFEVYKDKAGEYRWRMKADDKILAVSEDSYKGVSGAKTAVENIRKNAANKKWSVEVYEDKGKEYRWRLKAANGAVMAKSPAGFKTKEDAEKALAVVRKAAKSAKVMEEK
jgi:uncharacterized protein YegP (UPF0339 family)